MKTKNIFKTVAFAMLMPTMLLTTSCSSEDDLVNNTAGESTASTKGYALPVTVNVSRQGDEGTRATYDGVNKKLSFSTGDKLFVQGLDDQDESGAGWFSGALDYDAVSGKFSGTIYTQNEWPSTADALFSAASSVRATLLPNDYTSYGFLSIYTFDNEEGYDDILESSVIGKNLFARTKAAAVEQFSCEQTESYSDGFALAPMNAIVSFTISGLTANKEVAVSFTSEKGVISGNVTTSAEGDATFAVGVSSSQDLEDCTLTVDGNNIAMPTATTEAGHIYNISRSAVPPTDLSTINANYEAKDGETLTGTLASNVKISIADGATVTLKNVNITNLGNNCDWAGINCPGNATLVLEGTNEVCPGKDYDGDSNYPGIYIAPDKTLIIQGDGTLTAYSKAFKQMGAGIGGGYNRFPCGNITINGGTITATGGEWAAGIGGGGMASCGKITINGGTITATGGEWAAGIGGGFVGSCGTITITSGVTSVTATKGSDADNSIGAGNSGSCGTVSIEDPSKVTQN